MQMKRIITGLTAAVMSLGLAVVASAADNDVAKIGDTGYAALDAAVAAVKSGETIVLTDNVTVNSQINLPDGVEFTLDMNEKTITTEFAERAEGRTFSIPATTKLTVTGNGTITSNSWGTFNIVGELDVENGTYEAAGYKTGRGGGANLRGRAGSTINIADGVKISSETYTAVHSQGTLNVGKAILTSNSNGTQKDEYGYDNWSYCVIAEDKATFNGTYIQGIQGGLAVYGGEATINGGTYKGVKKDNYTSFYGLHITNGAKVTVNDGIFSSDDQAYCVLNSDDDDDLEVGTPIIINGGNFMGKVGTSTDSGYTMDGYTIYGGTFAKPDGIESALADSKTLDENGTVVDMLGESVQFAEKSDDEITNENAGRFFNARTAAANKTAYATFTSASQNKTVSKTLDLSKVSGEGDKTFSILLLGAPEDVSGTILYK